MTTWSFVHAGGSEKRNSPQAVSAGEETHQHQPRDAVWKQSTYLGGLPGHDDSLKPFLPYTHLFKTNWKKIAVNWQSLLKKLNCFSQKTT